MLRLREIPLHRFFHERSDPATLDTLTHPLGCALNGLCTTGALFGHAKTRGVIGPPTSGWRFSRASGQGEDYAELTGILMLR
jgi:hypothetical protein